MTCCHTKVFAETSIVAALQDEKEFFSDKNAAYYIFSLGGMLVDKPSKYPLKVQPGTNVLFKNNGEADNLIVKFRVELEKPYNL